MPELFLNVSAVKFGYRKSDKTHHQESVMGASTSKQAAMTTGRISWHTSLPQHLLSNHFISERNASINILSPHERIHFFISIKLKKLRKFRCSSIAFAFFFLRSIEEILFRFTERYRNFAAYRVRGSLSAGDRDTDWRSPVPTPPHAQSKTIFALFWIRFNRLGLSWSRNKVGIFG